MCKYRSGIATIFNDNVKVYTLPGNDSHDDIREHYHIADTIDTAGRQAPCELTPRGELTEYDKYDLIWDDVRPDWANDNVEQEVKHQMTAVVKSDDFTCWGGSLDLSGTGVTTLPDGLTVGGWLDLRGTGVTTLPGNAKISGKVFW